MSERLVIIKSNVQSIDPNSSEQALRRQIRRWLADEDGRESLLLQSIPQKGLEYSDEPVNKGTFYLSLVDANVNRDKEAVLTGKGTCFYSGYKSVLSGVDFQKVKYFVPVESHQAVGYYQVEAVEATDMSDVLKQEQEKLAKSGKSSQYKGFDKPIRICLKLGNYQVFPHPITYGLDRNAAIGVAMTRKEFKAYFLV